MRRPSKYSCSRRAGRVWDAAHKTACTGLGETAAVRLRRRAGRVWDAAHKTA